MIIDVRKGRRGVAAAGGWRSEPKCVNIASHLSKRSPRTINIWNRPFTTTPNTKATSALLVAFSQSSIATSDLGVAGEGRVAELLMLKHRGLFERRAACRHAAPVGDLLLLA